MKFLAIIFIFFFTCTQVKAECRLSDIKSIMGGDYTVDDLRGSLLTSNSRYVLIIYGKYTNAAGVSKGYSFIYDYSYCAATNFYEFGSVNQGIKEAVQTAPNGPVYMLGYNQPDENDPSSLTETVIAL